MQGLWVWSLIGELGSHAPCGQKPKNLTQKQYCDNFNKNLGKKSRFIDTYDNIHPFEIYSLMILVYFTSCATVTSVYFQHVFIIQKVIESP